MSDSSDPSVTPGFDFALSVKEWDQFKQQYHVDDAYVSAIANNPFILEYFQGMDTTAIVRAVLYGATEFITPREFEVFNAISSMILFIALMQGIEVYQETCDAVGETMAKDAVMSSTILFMAGARKEPPAAETAKQLVQELEVNDHVRQIIESAEWGAPNQVDHTAELIMKLREASGQ